MALLQGSRYQGLKLYLYKDEKGRPRSCLDIRRPITLDHIKNEVRSVIFQKGVHWLDLLVYESGGREDLWFIIADINEIEDPLNIESGAELLVPLAQVFLRWM